MLQVSVRERFAWVTVWKAGGAGRTKLGAVAPLNPIAATPVKWFGLRS